jgi:hypothetical protein
MAGGREVEDAKVVLAPSIRLSREDGRRESGSQLSKCGVFRVAALPLEFEHLNITPLQSHRPPHLILQSLEHFILAILSYSKTPPQIGRSRFCTSFLIIIFRTQTAA